MEKEINCGTKNSAEMHPIFSTDPAALMKYVGKEICVTTQDESTFTGRCYTVDPVSQSIALAIFSDRDELDSAPVISQLQIVFGHCVENITILDDNDTKYKEQLDSLFKNPTQLELSSEELKIRRDHLKLWLLKHRIPVEVSGDSLSVSDALVIGPPYDEQSCQSTNEIVLGKIQGLIKNMPKDVQEW